MSIGSVPNYGSASNWMKTIVGDGSQQYGDSLQIGQDNNRYWGNTILPKNFNGHTFGGSRRSGRRRRKGGSLAGALAVAAPPIALLIAQQKYKRGKNIYSRKYSSGSRRYGRSRRRFR